MSRTGSIAQRFQGDVEDFGSKRSARFRIEGHCDRDCILMNRTGRCFLGGWSLWSPSDGLAGIDTCYVLSILTRRQNLLIAILKTEAEGGAEEIQCLGCRR